MTRARSARLLGALAAMVLIATACFPYDFDGDNVADYVIFDDHNAAFFEHGEAVDENGFTPIWMSSSGGTGGPSLNAVWVPGDYDGDGRWEPAAIVNDVWETGGGAGDLIYDPESLEPGGDHSDWVPVPGNYDGTDNAWELAWFRPRDAMWFIQGEPDPIQFGIGHGGTPCEYGVPEECWYDVPLPGDYDGDYDTEIAVYRVQDGTFRTLDGGLIADVGLGYPAPADYDGDGSDDPAIYSPVDEGWTISGSPFVAQEPFEPSYYFPAPADYDGDLKADPTLYEERAGTFHHPHLPPSSETVVGGWPAATPRSLFVALIRLTFAIQSCADGGVCPPGI